MRSMNKKREAGFSLIELLTVCVVMLIAAAVAIPNMINAVHLSRLRAAGSDFSSLAQVARIRAVQDDRFYTVRILAGPPQQAYVDIFPQSNTGASGNGGTGIAAGDPLNPINSEISPQAVASAPNTANLKTLFLPAGSPLTPKDGSTSAGAITFGPRGLPCSTLTATGGTVCDSQGGATAYWIFFQNTQSLAWEAVTVSPAGRIRRWIFSGPTSTGGWSAL
jgi:prepilin-type N-terminal cleavage/methylation domain-containing protein